MSNDFKKGFLTGAGGLLGVLSIPIGVYILYLLYLPTTMSLQKKEYLNWVDCESSVAIKTVYQAYEEGYSGREMTKRIKELRVKACGEQPKRWKWQFSNKWLICME